MPSEHVKFISNQDKALLRALLTDYIHEVWFVRPMDCETSRFDRPNFLRAEAILLRGSTDYYIHSNADTMPSGYDEFLIGVSPDWPDFQQPRRLVVRRGANEPVPLDGNPFCGTGTHVETVRTRIPIRRKGMPPDFYHLFDSGLLFSRADGARALIAAHTVEAGMVEVSTNQDAIAHELAGHDIVPL